MKPPPTPPLPHTHAHDTHTHTHTYSLSLSLSLSTSLDLSRPLSLDLSSFGAVEANDELYASSPKFIADVNAATVTAVEELFSTVGNMNDGDAKGRLLASTFET